MADESDSCEPRRQGGGQPGNQNGKLRAEFREAVRRALARDGGTVSKGLDKLANKLISCALEGEQWAMKEVADRLDGKAAQTVYVGDAPEAITAPDADALTQRLAAALAHRAGAPTPPDTVQ